MNIEILEKIGLDKKEIQVYLALLKFGEITASRVSKETNIDRATCYRYLDSLISKGFVSYVVKENIKYFQAAHPDKILKDLKEKQEEYKKILPDLVGLTNLPKKETRVEVFKGKEGIKTVLRMLLRNKKNQLVLGDEGHAQEILPIFFEQFIRDCSKLKIKEKILCSEEVKKKIKKFDYKYSETRGLENREIIPTTTLIFDEGIILFNWVEPYEAVVITNKDIAKSYSDYFNILWKTAKK